MLRVLGEDAGRCWRPTLSWNCKPKKGGPLVRVRPEPRPFLGSARDKIHSAEALASQCAMKEDRILKVVLKVPFNHSMLQMRIRGGGEDKLAGEAEGTLQAAASHDRHFAFARAQAS